LKYILCKIFKVIRKNTSTSFILFNTV